MRFVSLVTLILTALISAGALADQQVLIVIDMQSAFIDQNALADSKENQKRYLTVIENQKKLIKAAMKKGIPVLFVEYKGYNPTNKELTDLVKNYDRKGVVAKSTDDLFTRHNRYLADVISQLESWDATDLIIAGANGGACVRDSIEGALKSGYGVLAYCGGIIDFNFQIFKFPYVNWRSTADYFKRQNYPEFKYVKKLKDVFACEKGLKPN